MVKDCWLIDEIMNNKEQDEFNDYMKSKNDATYQINDNDYFTADEIIVDSENSFDYIK